VKLNLLESDSLFWFQ